MPEFFLELFSEEIPARMQREAGMELSRRCLHGLQFLKPTDSKYWYGPRRIAFSAIVNNDDSAAKTDFSEARGPREGAPQAAIEGFLRKFDGQRQDLSIENGYYVLKRNLAPSSAKQIIEADLVKLLAKFPWPKSMRWGQSGDFTWARPLRRVVCLVDGVVVPISFGPITADNETEGHRFLSKGAFPVLSADDWEKKLFNRKVVASQRDRQNSIVHGLNSKAAELGLNLAEDAALIEEVTGLVEWPVPLIGKIDPEFMDLPWEVRELSMKSNQRYFALRDSKGKPAPYFAFVSNIEANDGGTAIIAGNERVLRARLSDARHFWNLDIKTPLDELLPKLDQITFHAKIGTQGERVRRISTLSTKLADALNADGHESNQARWAGLLSKTDLVTGMVGEFPELQGIMGGYYAERSMRGWDGGVVGPAIRSHYQPKGPTDAVPTGTVAMSVAIADKLDTLIEFFKINEKPTGSSDPYGLRRAALGVIRIILENSIQLSLRDFLDGNPELLDFIYDRLRVLLRNNGKRHDVVAAVLAVNDDDDLLRIMKKTNAIAAMLSTEYGNDLLAAYKRAVNILKIEEGRDQFKYSGTVNLKHLKLREERELSEAIGFLGGESAIGSDGVSPGLLELEQFDNLLRGFSTLHKPVNAFFEKVTVNDPEPDLRINRLQLLASLRNLMHQIADFSKIEG